MSRCCEGSVANDNWYMLPPTAMVADSLVKHLEATGGFASVELGGGAPAGFMLSGRIKQTALAAAGAVVGGLLAIGLSSEFFPALEAWGNWLREVLLLLAEFDHNVSKGNFSLVRIAENGVGWGSSLAFSLLFVGGVLFVSLWTLLPTMRGAKGPPPKDGFSLDYLMVGFGCLMPLLAADLAWYHYFILTLPLFIFVLRPQKIRASGSRRAARALAQIYERWVSKFTEAPSAAMTALKDQLEGENK